MLIRTFRTSLLVAACLSAGLFSSSCFAQESIEDTFQRFESRTVYGVAPEAREDSFQRFDSRTVYGVSPEAREDRLEDSFQRFDSRTVYGVAGVSPEAREDSFQRFESRTVYEVAGVSPEAREDRVEDSFQRFGARTVYGVALEVRENRVVDTFDSTDDVAAGAAALWEHRTSYFAEFLYLHPRGIDLAHATQQAGAGGAGTTPFGRVGVVDPGAEAGIRTGFSFCLDSCSSLAATFSHFESTARDSIDIPITPGMNGTVGSLVHHPGAVLIGSTGPATAAYGVDFNLVDFDYRRLICGSEDGYLNYSLGVRYGNLEQNFVQQGDFVGGGGVVRTTTDIDFDGVGVRFGLDGERRVGCGAWTFYGKSSISALAGQYRSDYLMVNTTGSVVLANSVWHDDRFTTVFDYELGFAWRDSCNRWRLSAGYSATFWYNAVTTPEFVRAVQNSNFVDLGDTVSFDGLTARIEYQW